MDDDTELGYGDVAVELDSGAMSVLVEQRARHEDEDEKDTTLFVASTDDEDRAMDTVKQDWKLANFRANPVILDNHYAMRVVGRATEAKVPRSGDDAGRLMIRVQWDLTNPDPSIAAVGHQHLNGFRSAGSVGFRYGKKTERHKLDQGDKYYRAPMKIETPWGSYERSGYLYEQNELHEFSSATVPMNPRALQRSARDYLTELASRELDEIHARARTVAETVDRVTAAEILKSIENDPEAVRKFASLLYADILAKFRTDPDAGRQLQTILGARKVAREPIRPVGDGLDFLFTGFGRGV